ncbi:MAG TPA: glycosyltransferase family 39 protein [Candidatus Binatia bacterium]|nr:glycosyltransferase family 39 protein [Candidatus Binatia bacterium]
MTSRRWDLPIALVVAVAVFFLQLPFRLHAVNLVDEGAIYQFADELLRGKLPYTDVVHPAFPVVHYVIAATFALFGSSWDTGRTFGAALFAVTTAIVFLIARWWLGLRGLLAVVLLFLCYRVWAYPHWHMVSYSSLAVTFLLLEAWIVGETLVRPRRWPLVAAGLVAGIAMLTKQDSGVLGSGAIGLAILLGMPHGTRWRSAFTFGLTAAGVVLVAAAVAVATGIAPDLVRATIEAPLAGFGYAGYQNRPALWPFWHQDAALRERAWAYFPTIIIDAAPTAVFGSAIYRETAIVDALLKLVYHLPWMVFVLAVLDAARRRVRGVVDPRELLLLLLSGAFLLAFNRPQDWVHLLVLYPTTLLLGSLLVVRAVWATGRLRRMLTGVAWLGLAGLLVIAGLLAVGMRRSNAAPVHGPRGTIYVNPVQAQGLQAFVDMVADAPPDVPMLALPYHPGLNYLTGRSNLSRYYVTWPAEPDLGRTADFIRDLERHPDGLVVYTPSQVPHFPRMAQYDLPFFGYLADHYQIARVVGGEPWGFEFFLLERKTPPAGEPLRGAALAAAEVTVATAGAPPRVVTGDERAALVRETMWPFCRVIAIAAPARATVALRYRVTPGATTRFQGSFGINPDLWMMPRTATTFTVRVEPLGGAAEVVRTTALDPFADQAQRHWHALDVDLAPWSGRPVDVVLAVDGPLPPDYAGWCDLRVLRP